MRDRFVRISKTYKATKQVLLDTKRKVIIRTLGQKLHECKRHLHAMKEQKVKLQRTNRVLLQKQGTLLKQISALEKANNELRDFISNSVTRDLDFNDDDDLLEKWEEPRSPESLSSQRAMIDLTPKKTQPNQEQRGKSVKLKLNNEEMTRKTSSPSRIITTDVNSTKTHSIDKIIIDSPNDDDFMTSVDKSQSPEPSSTKRRSSRIAASNINIVKKRK